MWEFGSPGSETLSYLKTVKRRLSEESVRRSALRILRENPLCSMATIAPGNRAHINTAYFCFSPHYELFFLSDPASLHCRNLGRNSSMAVTVFRSSQVWGDPDRGLQLFGRCREALGRTASRAAQLYGTRFPRFAKLMKGKTASQRRQAAQLRSYSFYRFVPDAMKILDETTFGGSTFVSVEVPKPDS